MEYRDYYKIMGLARDASADDIKRAHRDRLGANWRAGQDFRPPPDWNAGTERPGGFEWHFEEGDADAGGDFSDFFESLFRHRFDEAGGQRAGARRHAAQGSGRQAFSAAGQDHHARILIDLEDAYTGAEKTLSLQVPEVTPEGRVTHREHQIRFKVPRGIRAGQHIRLAGQGEPGIGQGPAGDLYLEVDFSPRAPGSPNYRVERHDVYLDLPIAPWEAALGAEVRAPTLTGEVDVKVPSGSATGRKLRLKGRGIPGSTPGDFYFVLQIVQPPADNEADRTFFKDMARQFKGFNPRAQLGSQT
ncbi:MAG: DnaJ C-terminal domain-containing protein [Pseudomonadota bacterium]